MIIVGLVLGLAPFIVFVGETFRTIENGAITRYLYLNYFAIGAGIAAVGIAIALLRRDPERGERPPRWVIPVCAVLVLLGAFQVARGAGVFPGITGCTSETGSAGFCKASG